ncbi:hypothetical protein BTS2_1620 [Bacillus sp. TS-2]|nr:hypothetical protein BTS2_1620 [Bacillus sp. TS-2]
MFSRTENFYTFRKNYPIITIIIAIHLIIFLWINLLPGGEWIRFRGVGFNLGVELGEYWRLVTPIFMHVSLTHLLFNSASLVIFGPPLEQMLGKAKFILLYLSSGILANIATFFIGGLDYPPHLGASGAIFGIFGAYFFIALLRKDLIDRNNSQLILMIFIAGIVMTFVNSNINIYAHIFGAIAGAAVIPLLLNGVKPFYRPINMVQQKDPDEIQFNPNRWNNKKFSNSQLKIGKIFWIAFGVIVLIGLLSRFV